MLLLLVWYQKELPVCRCKIPKSGILPIFCTVYIKFETVEEILPHHLKLSGWSTNYLNEVQSQCWFSLNCFIITGIESCIGNINLPEMGGIRPK